MNRQRRPTLVRRLTWGVCLVSVLAFILQVAVLSIWLRPLGSQFALSAADSARQARAALQAVPAEQRPALAHALGTRTHRLRAAAPPSLAAAADDPPFEPPGMQAMRRALQDDGMDLQLRSPPGDDAVVLFSLPVDGTTWWLEMRLWRPTLVATGTLALWLGLIAFATAVALWWSVHAIARPLDHLAGHLGAQDAQLHTLPEERFGTHELHTVARAFNTLVLQVRQHADTRQQLLAGVSHDLRTPLSRLRLRVETQCEDDVAGELTADLLALEHIVDQFLAYVQGDGQSQIGNPRPLLECVRQVVAPYQAAGQAVHESLQAVQLPADALAVRRLLSNLIDNALDYGKTPVTVVLTSSVLGTELQVWDHGRGMSADEFKAAQQPFVRLDTARTDVGHCGLGLAIAAQMARHLGGGLHIARDAGLGFGIVLRLPR